MFRSMMKVTASPGTCRARRSAASCPSVRRSRERSNPTASSSVSRTPARMRAARAASMGAVGAVLGAIP
jgi:hypothetical protein